MTEAREAIAAANLKASKMDRFMRDYFDVDAFLTALSEAGWVVEQGWQPIETAPKDGTLIDVWCGHPDGELSHRVRFTDVSWHDADHISPHTGWVRVLDGGDWDPIERNALFENGCPAWKIIVWRPLPPPPPAKGGDDE